MLTTEYGTASNIKSRVNRCVLRIGPISRRCARPFWLGGLSFQRRPGTSPSGDAKA